MFLRRLHFNLPPPWNSSSPCLSVPPHSDRSIYLRRKLASISSLSITERLFIVFALGVQLASSHFFPRPLRVTPTKTPKHSHCRYKSKKINWKLKFASVPHKSKKQTEKTSTFHSIVHFSFACRFAFYFLFPFPFVSINLSFICIFPSLFFLPFLFFIICSLCLAFPLWLFHAHKHTNTHSLAHLSGAYGHFGWSVVQRSSTSLVRPSPFRHGASQCTDYVLCAVPFSFVVDIVIVVARISVAIVVVVKWPTYSVCVDHIDRLLSIDRSRLQRATLVAAATEQMHTVHRVWCEPIDCAATVPTAFGHRVRNTRRHRIRFEYIACGSGRCGRGTCKCFVAPHFQIALWGSWE